MKKIIFKLWPILIVLAFGLLAGRTLLGLGYFVMHDDLQMMRQFEMEKCFADFQIPCRWVPDMGYGFGFPLFNFYPPLPYLIGEVFRAFRFSFVDTIKIVFVLSMLLSGLTMYFLAKEFFRKVGGILSSIFYIWAPYHSVDVFVRGAMNEAWALVWFPAILLSSYKLVTNNKKQVTRWVLILALSWAGLLLSHNLMVLIFAPVFAGWCLLHIVTSDPPGGEAGKKQVTRKIFNLLLSGVLALGLSAFFTLPAILEQKYVQVNTLVSGYYEYIAHFVSLRQLLISRFWGYGPSIWGTQDGMSFQIGHVHWILSLIIIFVFMYRYIKTKKTNNLLLVTYYLFLVGWFAAFMTHSRSTPVWQLIPFLKFVQFPWRFLTIVILCFSFMAGSVVLIFPKKLSYWIAGILVTGLLILNWNYFQPLGGKLGPLTDNEKFSGAAWELQQTAGIYDYLPKDAKEAPKEPRKQLAEIFAGDGQITNQKSGTNWASFQSTVDSRQSTVRINIFNFPDWRVFIDGKQVKTFVPKDEKWGRMWIEVPKGAHQVYARLYNTPIRTASNAISLVSWILLAVFLVWRRKFLFSD